MPDDTRLPAASAAIGPRLPTPNFDLPRAPFDFTWRYVREFPVPVATSTLLFGIVAVIDTLQAYVLGRLVTVLADQRAGDSALWFIALCSTWFGSYVISNAYAGAIYRVHIVMRTRIHEDLFAYLLEHAPRYFMDHTSGSLAHKIRSAASSTAVLVDHIAGYSIRFLVLIGTTAVMVSHNAPHLLLPGAVFIVLFGVLAGVLAQRLRPLAQASSHAASEQSGRMGDAATNWDLVRSFAASSHERASLEPFNSREAKTFMGVRVAAVRMRVILHSVSFILLAWLAWSAFASTRAGEINVGTFTMLVTLYMLVGAYVRSFGDILFSYFENLGQLTDALKTVLAPHEIVDPPGAVPLQVRGGAIELRNVDFNYPDGTPVFQNFNLNIAAGEKIGLVGASGAGKSTLIKLIRRQFPLAGGRILVDGQDVARVTWDSVHDAFAEVPQTPGMFHRSVRENIAYGRPGATEDEIFAAAKAAHCHDFIASRAQGYDSVVGEKGMKLSGGERQRVAIARAFLKNAQILLLDEATSSLDSEAEHLIQAGLISLMEGRTVIAIAHRLSTIMHLDRIVVLENGRVVEQGSHDTLLAKNGAYARLWQHQVGGFM